MTEDVAGEVCHRCGTPRSGGSEFCPVCDTFFGWHDDAPPDAAPGTAPAGAPVAPGRPPGAATPAPPPPPSPPAAPAAPRVDRVRPPVVSTEATEVVVSREAPGTFPLVLRNGSTIVEAYELALVDPPSWLRLLHGDTNLLPEQQRTVAVTLAVADGHVGLAQTLPVTVQVRSGVDPARTAEVALTVTVPRSGPPATLVAHPTLVRMQDTEEGSVALRLDNRASNHPRTYALSASDPEDVVRVDFVPPVVTVGAGDVADTTVRCRAPLPPPGEEAARQLTLTATDDESPVVVHVTLAQATTAPPERRPLKLRLEPSQLALTDTTQARTSLVVDNRGGHEEVVVELRGRDPAGAVSFDFDHNGFRLPAGQAVRLGLTVSSGAPPPGGTVVRPFAVVAAGGGLEAQIDGSLELTARASAISTAALRLVPDHLVVKGGRGTFRVEVDNRRGLEPLHVGLNGADEFGRASLRFSPAQVTVAPGQVGLASLTVSHPRPEGGTSESRRVRVSAFSGAESVSAEAVLTQESASYRTWWAYTVALVGIALVAVGGFVAFGDLTFGRADEIVRGLVQDAQDDQAPAGDAIRDGVVVLSLALVGVSLLMMLFGLVGTTGKGVRVGAVVAAVAGIAAAVVRSSGMSVAGTVGGFGLVLVGAAVAFAGGVLIRHLRS